MKRFLTILLLLLFAACAGAEGTAFRALCVGVSNYDDGRVRVGGYNSVKGVYDALTLSHPNMDITMLVDPSGSELLKALSRETAAMRDDETLIVYINSHGGAQGGLTWLEAGDGERITPAALRNALDGVKGQVLLIIDCCMSGGFIGAGAYTDELANGLLRPFGGNLSGTVNAFASTRFMVLASSSFDQNSYRIASSSATEESMSTVFSRSLCEALGWDLINDRSTTLKADTDGDKKVSFTEMCAYVRQRCMYYLSFSSPARQTVQFMPETSALIVADRSERRN